MSPDKISSWMMDSLCEETYQFIDVRIENGLWHERLNAFI